MALNKVLIAFSKFNRSLDSFWLTLIGKLPWHKEDINTRESSQPSRKHWIKILEWPVAIFGILISIGFGLVSNAPKLSVDVSGSLQSASPMATVFYLSNEGLLPVHSVVVTCDVVKATGVNGIGFILEDSLAEKLSPGHKMTLPCAHAVAYENPTDATEAEMTIKVDYRPDWLWYSKTDRFPWKAEKTTNGSWIWHSIPR